MYSFTSYLFIYIIVSIVVVLILPFFIGMNVSDVGLSILRRFLYPKSSTTKVGLVPLTCMHFIFA